MAIGKPFGSLWRWLGGATRRNGGLTDDLWRETVDGLPFLARLSREESSRLRRLAERFLAEKEFTAAGGLELTGAMCASIAVQGCLPILDLGLECYRGWVGVIVYPDEFIVPRAVEDEFGVVHEYDDVASGEAWEGGPLLISWRDAQMAGGGYNVVIHEFVHKLDMLNGEVDGIPPLPAGISRREWEDTLLAAYEDFRARVDAVEARGESTGEVLAIDPYAAESPGEFFAVLSESFFETPDVPRREYPALYALFCRFFRATSESGKG
ncbi:MAG: zinc-dependent peptidase [Candidatus Accumulibacter sp.]|jgi:Mlc titration factor MtfA (ptsG expression regulator)|nr:zinc-dependent peptidase [Accumulibacter sp.]